MQLADGLAITVTLLTFMVYLWVKIENL